jgi:hypothetical protein
MGGDRKMSEAPKMPDAYKGKITEQWEMNTQEAANK